MAKRACKSGDYSSLAWQAFVGMRKEENWLRSLAFDKALKS